MSELLKIELTLPGDGENDVLRERLNAWLAANSPLGWEESEAPGQAAFRFYLEPGAPLAGNIERVMAGEFPGVGLSATPLEQQDWSRAWREFFVPVVSGGHFEVLPPWLAGQARPEYEPIIIEPKMAFGTGHHATTYLCLEALAKAAEAGRIGPGSIFLDLGTGTGILAIGLTKLGCRGMGLDIDPQAIFCAAENLALNNLETWPALAVGGLESLAPGAAFDCIVANILAVPLMDMAKDIVAHLRPGAVLVLSGLLATQALGVAKAYTDLGLPEPMRVDREEWSALVWA